MNVYPVSPNTVLANALTHAEDVLLPRIKAQKPDRIVFTVGTQINGVPHIGTSLVHSLAFATAARIRDRFDVAADVSFGALDNAPAELATDPDTGHHYQRAHAQALGEDAVRAQVEDAYGPLFAALSERTDVPHQVHTYSVQQRTEVFRRAWLRVLPRVAAARWWLAPSTGVPHVRVPCPAPGCGWAEKYAERTAVQWNGGSATVNAVCLHHGPYQVVLDTGPGGYLDLATLYRNLVKELALADGRETLHVMVKGGDWVFGSHLVDGALDAIGRPPRLPVRLFCPQVVTDTGAKLSKSLIREGRADIPEGAAPWVLDTRLWDGTPEEYAASLLNLADVLFSDPRHFFRSYSAPEITRMMTTGSLAPQ